MGWPRATGCGRRNQAGTATSRCRHLIASKLRTRSLPARRGEAAIAAAALNTTARTAKPVTVRAAWAACGTGQFGPTLIRATTPDMTGDHPGQGARIAARSSSGLNSLPAHRSDDRLQSGMSRDAFRLHRAGQPSSADRIIPAASSFDLRPSPGCGGADAVWFACEHVPGVAAGGQDVRPSSSMDGGAGVRHGAAQLVAAPVLRRFRRGSAPGCKAAGAAG